MPEERVKPFPRQRTRKRARRQPRVRRSAPGLKLPRAEGRQANGEGASASRDGRPAALPSRARGKIFRPPRPPHPLFLLRGLGHGVVLARGVTALARVSGRRGEAVAVASRAGARGSAATLRLAPPGVAGCAGRLTCPGAERLCRRVSGAGNGEPRGPSPDCGRAPWPRCEGRGREDGALCPPQQQHPSLSASEPGSPALP